jgi:histidinol-phosphate aminotransferase
MADNLKTPNPVPNPVPSPRAGVLDLPAYVGGRESVEGIENPYKLSANENPLGPSPKAVAAIQALAAEADLAIYPDGGARQLRAKLAQVNGLKAEQIVCGNGSGDVLQLLAQAYLEAGDEVLYTEHGFLLYKLASTSAGATPICVAETNRTADVDALLAKVSEKTKIVFLANPNNPTGTMLPMEEISSLHAGLASDVLLVLDGAYAEYVAPEKWPADFAMVEQFSNVVATRTFSKAYGLAALRLGWAYCPPGVADALNRVRGPFNVNAMALAGGLAALEDPAHIETSRAHNAQWRDWLGQQLGALGYEIKASEANFIVLDFGTAEMASAADAFLCRQGVIARGLAAYAMPTALRLTVGTQEGNRAAVDALQAFQQQAGAAL